MAFPTTNHKGTLLFISLLWFAIAVVCFIVLPDLARVLLAVVLGLLLVCATPIAYRHRRRWFRFSLRTLLILVTLLSVPLGWIGWRLGQVRSEQATIAWIEKMGGRVSYPSWFSGRVRSVNLQFSPVRDVSPLVGLKSLEILSLYSTEVADVSPLAEIETLKSL